MRPGAAGGTGLAGAEIRRYSSDRRGGGTNGLLAVAAGATAALSETLILPPIVLAFFVGQLTASYAAVGLVSAIVVGLWAIARLPAVLLVGTQRHKQPWALAGILVRAAALGLLAVVSFRAPPGGGPGDGLLRSFFVCLVAYAVAGGFSSVPAEAMVAKAVPNPARARFYRRRGFWAMALAIGGALVVARLFQDAGGSFPRQYALLFLAATVCQVAIAVFVASMREPVRVADVQGFGLGVVRAVPAALADAACRRFLLFRALLSLLAVVDPFLIIFAFARLGASVDAVGGYVLAWVVGVMLSQPIWAAVTRIAGNRAALQLAALLRLVPPLLALLLPTLVATVSWRARFAGAPVAEVLFGIAFVCIGASAAGQGRANFGYLAEAAPARLRPAWAAATNGVLAVVAFAPVAAGLLIDRAGFDALFLAVAILGVAAVFASGLLPNTFVRGRPSNPALRPRLEATIGPASLTAGPTASESP